jgi:hypothetical protein
MTGFRNAAAAVMVVVVVMVVAMGEDQDPILTMTPFLTLEGCLHHFSVLEQEEANTGK